MNCWIASFYQNQKRRISFNQEHSCFKSQPRLETLIGVRVQSFEMGVFAVLGVISGSFVNVCLARLPLQFADGEKRSCLLTSPKLSTCLKNHLREKTISLYNPARSFCFSCGHQLSWVENIPVLSYFLNSGHCRKCNEPIGTGMIVTEIVHGLVYLGFGWFLNGWIWPLTFSINFSFLWILVHCWNCQKARMTLFITGVIILLFNLGIYLIHK